MRSRMMMIMIIIIIFNTQYTRKLGIGTTENWYYHIPTLVTEREICNGVMASRGINRWPTGQT
jgi:hypothetical protein